MTRFSVAIYDTSARAILPPCHVGVDLPAAIGRACRETERLDDRPDVRRVAVLDDLTGDAAFALVRTGDAWEVEALAPAGRRTVDPLPPEAVTALDPRVREVVVKLRAAGFETTDSGDGSKAETMEGALPMPHVFVRCPDPAALQSECARLVAALRRWGVEVVATDDPRAAQGFPTVQATYDPEARPDLRASLAVFDVVNEDLSHESA